MNHHYADIRRLTLQPPKWFDEHAVPRYCDFSHDQVANIYADEAVLAEIACQDCGHIFQVAFSSSRTFRLIEIPSIPSLEEYVRNRTLHYGDPPNIDCCPAGPTMNSTMIRVLEFHKQVNFDWVRVPELEMELHR